RSVLANERVEARHVLVEPEDVRDRLRERGARLRTDVSSNRLDMQLFAAGHDAQGPSAARGGQRRLECPCGQLDAIRWQLCDSVRDDCAREVDWLAASAVEWKVSDASQRIEYREQKVEKPLRTMEWVLLRFDDNRLVSLVHMRVLAPGRVGVRVVEGVDRIAWRDHNAEARA